MAKPVLNEKTIADYMKRNKVGRDEAIDLIKYDIAVESEEATEYDLTAEQQKAVSEMMRKTEHKKQSGAKRERKPNELKEGIVAEIAEFLRQDAQNHVYESVEITNPNRMMAFEVDGKRFELTLIEKRAPKK